MVADRPASVRSMLKNALAEGLVRSGLHRVVGSVRGLAGAPLVLGYHRVVGDFAASASLAMPSLLVSTATLGRQLEWIGRSHEFVTMDELALVSAGVLRMRKPVAALTFDDGYRDVFEQGLPLLQRMGIPATVYVVSDLINTDRLQRHDELYLLFALLQRRSPGKCLLRDLAAQPALSSELRRLLDAHATPFLLTRFVLETQTREITEGLLRQLRDLVQVDADVLHSFRALDWPMLKAWLQAGMTVGSHTCSHPFLPGLPAPRLRVELQRSRSMLEAGLGVPVHHFAYPDGQFDAAVISAVAAAGYRTAATICGHVDPRHRLLTMRRRMLWEHSSSDASGSFSPNVLSCQANGIFDPADRCRHHH